MRDSVLADSLCAIAQTQSDTLLHWHSLKYFDLIETAFIICLKAAKEVWMKAMERRLYALM